MTPNRRASERFPIRCQMTYRLTAKKKIAVSGRGETLNISSSGILFTTSQALPTGRRMEINIDWPAQLDAKHFLCLVATGPLVRCQDGQAAMVIQRYKFRTMCVRQEA